MARTVRLSVALVIALIMVMALAGTALAFNPPDNAPVGVGANNLCRLNFPAAGIGVGPGTPGGFGPWHATSAADPPGPIPFGSNPPDNVCVVP